MRLHIVFISVALLSCTLHSQATSVLLVKGTRSNPDAGERAYAAKLTDKMSHWLNDFHVPHDVIDDDAVIQGVPATARIMILCYNPHLPQTEIRSLKNFLRRDGKLIVFYGASSELATAMGFALGPYRAGGEAAPWHSFQFNAAAPPHLPARIRQSSRHTRQVAPARSDAKIIAYWEDQSGHQLNEAAWLQSNHGFWMTHVLLNDGDVFNKKRLLLGLVATADPSVWKSAASHCLQDAAGIGRFQSFNETLAAIKQAATGSPRQAEIATTVQRATDLHTDLVTRLSQNGVAAVVKQSADLQRLLFEAFGLAQESRPNELKGVWDHKGVGLYPGDWPRTAALLAKQGVTAVYSNVLWPGAAHYKSALVPASPVMRAHGDQLQAGLDATHAAGMEFHAWKVCWWLDRAAPTLIETLKTQKRLQVSDSGKVLNWLCPSHPDNLKMEKDAVREVVRKYAVDGIHLDYVRYPDSHACYCDGCRLRLERHLGRPIHHWPPLRHELLLKKQVRDWRAMQITRLVQDLNVAIKQIRPGTKLSAAVYGRYPLCAESVGQDWGRWLKEGYIDYVCPMNYTDDISRFKALVQDQMALPAAQGKVVPGLGVTATESVLDPLQVIEQIQTLRAEGAGGFVLFDLNRTLEEDILPILGPGITAPSP